MRVAQSDLDCEKDGFSAQNANTALCTSAKSGSLALLFDIVAGKLDCKDEISPASKLYQTSASNQLCQKGINGDMTVFKRVVSGELVCDRKTLEEWRKQTKDPAVKAKIEEKIAEAKQ